jgi:hypothetical protein
VSRSVIAILRNTWVVLMLIFGGLLVTGSIEGFMVVAFAGVILAIGLIEMWGRYGRRGEVDHE